MPDTRTLKKHLDRLAASYDARYLDTDPLGIVHRYSGRADREVAGVIAASLAYGGAGVIRASIERALEPSDGSPTAFAASLTPEHAMEAFAGFKHRWTDCADIAFLWFALGRILDEYGTVGAYVRSHDVPSEPDTGGVMSRFARSMLQRRDHRFPQGGNRSPSYLVPAPDAGSACKRTAMLFRWMVRGPDGVDFGLWNFIDPARLVIPVDRHIARMAARLGLTERKTVNWRMAQEITAALRLLDPADPVRYDFALVRPGITGVCTPHGTGCPSCTLAPVCREAR